MSRILVLSDDLPFASAIAVALRGYHHVVCLVQDTIGAMLEVDRFDPAVIVVDLAVPAAAGVQALECIRPSVTVPVITLSGRATSAEKRAAMAAGADDYLSKPFLMRDLLAIIRAAERRPSPIGTGDENLVVTEHFTVDLDRGQVFRKGKSVSMTPMEWMLLALLLQHIGAVITETEMLSEVWGPAFGGETFVCRAVVAQLKRKLEPDPAHPRYLLRTGDGGYRFQR